MWNLASTKHHFRNVLYLDVRTNKCDVQLLISPILKPINPFVMQNKAYICCILKLVVCNVLKLRELFCKAAIIWLFLNSGFKRETERVLEKEGRAKVRERKGEAWIHQIHLIESEICGDLEPLHSCWLSTFVFFFISSYSEFLIVARGFFPQGVFHVNFGVYS